MVDTEYKYTAEALSDVADKHFVITKSDTINYFNDAGVVAPRAVILNNGSGNITIVDKFGTSIQYNIDVSSGGIFVLPIRPAKVMSTGTDFTGTIIGIN